MNTVIRVTPLAGSRLKLTFADGFIGTADVRPFIGKGFTESLLEPDQFDQVATEPGGGIAWSNGFDLCPEFLRELAGKRQAAT